MKEIEKLLLQYHPIEIDQQRKEQQIKSLMNDVKATNVINNQSFIRNIIIQIPYIDKKSILLQIILMIIGVWLTYDLPAVNVKTTINIISSIGAFLAIVDLVETRKSYQYHMWEIESSCKNSLRELMIQRYLITGILSILVIVILSIVTTVNLKIGFVNLLLYFMTPFMFVCWSYLKLLKITRNHINEAVLLSSILLVCGMIMIFISNLDIYSFYEVKEVGLAFGIVLLLYLYEVISFVGTSREETEWN